RRRNVNAIGLCTQRRSCRTGASGFVLRAGLPLWGREVIMLAIAKVRMQRWERGALDLAAGEISKRAETPEARYTLHSSGAATFVFVIVRETNLFEVVEVTDNARIVQAETGGRRGESSGIRGGGVWRGSDGGDDSGRGHGRFSRKWRAVKALFQSRSLPR